MNDARKAIAEPVATAREACRGEHHLLRVAAHPTPQSSQKIQPLDDIHESFLHADTQAQPTVAAASTSNHHWRMDRFGARPTPCLWIAIMASAIAHPSGRA